MLGLSDEEFKVAVAQMFQQAGSNSCETNGKMKFSAQKKII